MRKVLLLLVLAILALGAGCGGDDEEAQPTAPAGTATDHEELDLTGICQSAARPIVLLNSCRRLATGIIGCRLSDLGLASQAIAYHRFATRKPTCAREQ